MVDTLLRLHLSLRSSINDLRLILHVARALHIPSKSADRWFTCSCSTLDDRMHVCSSHVKEPR